MGNTVGTTTADSTGSRCGADNPSGEAGDGEAGDKKSSLLESPFGSCFGTIVVIGRLLPSSLVSKGEGTVAGIGVPTTGGGGGCCKAGVIVGLGRGASSMVG